MVLSFGRSNQKTEQEKIEQQNLIPKSERSTSVITPRTDIDNKLLDVNILLFLLDTINFYVVKLTKTTFNKIENIIKYPVSGESHTGKAYIKETIVNNISSFMITRSIYFDLNCFGKIYFTDNFNNERIKKDSTNKPIKQFIGTIDNQTYMPLMNFMNHTTIIGFINQFNIKHLDQNLYNIFTQTPSNTDNWCIGKIIFINNPNTYLLGLFNYNKDEFKFYMTRSFLVEMKDIDGTNLTKYRYFKDNNENSFDLNDGVQQFIFIISNIITKISKNSYDLSMRLENSVVNMIKENISKEKRSLDSKITKLNAEKKEKDELILNLQQKVQRLKDKIKILNEQIKNSEEMTTGLKDTIKSKTKLCHEKQQECESLRLKNQKLRNYVEQWRKKGSINDADTSSIFSLTGSEYPDYEFDKCSCAICFDSFRQSYRNSKYEFPDGNEIVAIKQCGHVFHAKCISEAFSIRKQCPLCNIPITGEDTQRLLFHV